MTKKMDIRLEQDSYGFFSLNILDGDFESEEGFDTAINMSLFTDAEAPESKVSKPENRRGWLGDLVSPTVGRKIGSWLWLLDQARLTTANLNTALNYSKLALDWIVEDGLAKKIEVSGEIVIKKGFQIEIVIFTNTGEKIIRYKNLWENTGDA